MSSSKTTQRSQSASQGLQVGFGQTFIAPTQLPFINALNQAATGLVGQQLGQIGDVAGGLSAGLGGQGQNFLGTLMQQAQGGVGGLGDIAGALVGPSAAQGALGALAGAGGPGVNLPSFAGFNPQAGFGFEGGFAPSAANPLAGFTPGAPVDFSGIGGRAVDFGSFGGRAAPDFAAAIQAQGPQFNVGAGTDLSRFVTGPNPGLQGQINALDAAIEQNLRSNLGAIGGQATLGGVTGGSRQALASGLAAQEASRQFAAGASDLVSQDFAQRTQLAGVLAQEQARQDLAREQLRFQGVQEQARFGQAQDQLRLAAQEAAANFGLGQDQLGLAAQEAQARAQLGQDQLQLAARQAGADVNIQQTSQALQAAVAQGDFQQAGDQLRLAADQLGLDAAQVGAQLGLSAEQLRLAGIETAGAQALDAGRLALGGRELQANILQSLAGLQQQGLLQAGQLGLSNAQLQQQAALGGLGNLQGLFNLGTSQFGAQLAPLQALAQIIGSPTVLQTSRNLGRQASASRGSTDAFSLGAGGLGGFI